MTEEGRLSTFDSYRRGGVHRRVLGLRLALVLSNAVLAGSACADVLWNEGSQGDLSNDRLNPTSFAMSAGTHSLFATTGSGDLDYISITLAPGTQLTQLNLVSYQGTDTRAFMGVQSGPAFTESPSTVNVANLLGWTHFGPGAGNVGANLLPGLGAGSGAIGFAPPLPSGTYSFWLQQLGSAVSYQLDFVVVPSPGVLALAPAACMLVRRRRESRRS